MESISVFQRWQLTELSLYISNAQYQMPLNWNAKQLMLICWNQMQNSYYGAHLSVNNILCRAPNSKEAYVHIFKFEGRINNGEIIS